MLSSLAKHENDIHTNKTKLLKRIVTLFNLFMHQTGADNEKKNESKSLGVL
jgi:hypothetical protein